MLTATGSEAVAGAPWRDIVYTVHDGLRLYARDYGDPESGATPVICLAGLTRNSKDFHEIATHLCGTRRVLAPDYRGRGRSEYARNYRSYAASVEMSDVLQLMTLAHLEEAIILGTSRGGIIGMLMAAARPNAVKAVILNDIGPHLPSAGLLRIAGYVRNLPAFDDWSEAVAVLKSIHGPYFTDLSEEDWLAFAQRTYRRDDGRLRHDFDPALARALDEQVDISAGEEISLWPQFAALLHKPVLVIRGTNSDLLLSETVKQMRLLKHDLRSVTIPHRGHPPFLSEPKATEAIDRFIGLVERA